MEQEVKPVHYSARVTSFLEKCKNLFRGRGKNNQVHSLNNINIEENQKLKNVQRKIR